MDDGASNRFPQAALVFYATHDGQSRRIATRIADRLVAHGIEAAAHDLGSGLPTQAELSRASLVVLIAAVRYGQHLPQAMRFLTLYRNLSRRPPLALASVNLTARKPNKSTADNNPYLRKLIARCGNKPVLAAAFAGRLDYPLYSWLDRQIIRGIMLLTGGPTDTRTCVVYTSWNAVDEFASRLSQLNSLDGGHNGSAAPTPLLRS